MNIDFRKRKTYYILLPILGIIFAINLDKIDNYIIKYNNFEWTIVCKGLDQKGQPLIFLTNKNEKEYHGIKNIKIYYIIEPGDYIIKRRGQNFYTLIKNKDSIIFRKVSLNILDSK